MVLTPIVTTEDIRLALNGTVTGSTYYFWEQSISSGSVLAQINLSNYEMYGLLGKTVMETTANSDETKYYHLRAGQLNMSCFRTLVVLSGGIITDGFTWKAGIEVSTPHIVEGYRGLISQFSESAKYHIQLLQDIAVTAESDVPPFGTTAPSMM